MLVFALVVLALLAAFMLGALLGSDGFAQLEFFGARVDTTSAGVLTTGFVVGLMTVLALVLIAIGARRTRVRRQREKQMRSKAAEAQAVAAERDTLAADKARLEQQVQDAGGSVTPSPDTGGKADSS